MFDIEVKWIFFLDWQKLYVYSWSKNWSNLCFNLSTNNRFLADHFIMYFLVWSTVVYCFLISSKAPWVSNICYIFFGLKSPCHFFNSLEPACSIVELETCLVSIQQRQGSCNIKPCMDAQAGGCTTSLGSTRSKACHLFLLNA